MSYLANDTFANRTVSSGWGTSSGGQTWTQAYGTSSMLSVGSNEGQITGSTSVTDLLLGTTTAANVDLKVRFSVSSTSDTISITFRSDSGASNCYHIRYTGTSLQFTKTVAGSASTLSGGVSASVTAGSFYWLHMQANGSSFSANLWANGSNEPSGWQCTTTDSTFSSAGYVGLRTKLNATTDTVKYDSFTANTLTDTRDLSMRSRVANATSTRDLSMRSRLIAKQTRDITMRSRIFAPTNTRDLSMRSRLLGFDVRDISMRSALDETHILVPHKATYSLSVKIGSNSSVTLLGSANNSFTIGKTIDGRSTCSFTLLDMPGNYRITYRQPVVVTHSVRGVIFRGYVTNAQEVNLPPNTTNTITVTCIDERWKVDKRVYEGNEFENQYAGTIATFFARELAVEGITTGYAIDYDTTQADFSEGILSNVVASTTIGTTSSGDGDLELAPAGNTLSITETTVSDFFDGTLSNTFAYGGQDDASGYLALNVWYAIKFTANATLSGGGNLYTYNKIWSGSYTIGAGDSLLYDVWIASTSPAIQAAVDLGCSDGSTLRDFGGQACQDQQGLHAHPGTDLSNFAKDQWYSRTISLTPLAGKTVSYATVAFEGDGIGAYTAYYRNVRILTALGATLPIYSGGTTNVSPAQQLQDSGYANVTVSTITAFDKSGSRISPPYPLDDVQIARQSLISWNAGIPTTPSGVTLTIEASLDNGVTWLPCTNNQPLPGLLPGMITAGRSLLLRETITNGTPDPTQSALLFDVTATIASSFQGTKIDVGQITTSSADWQAGTLSTGLVYANGALSLNGATRTWDDANKSNQTTFGDNAPSVAIQNGMLQLTSANNAAVTSRLDFAGTWKDFIAEVDVNVGALNGSNIGMTYRTTGWQNNNDTYAYSVYVNNTQIVFGVGTNSSSGSGTFTQKQSASLSLSSGNTHRLKVVVSTSGGITTHQAYLDDVRYINTTENSYTAAGSIGLRLFNSLGNMFLTSPGLVAGTHYTTVTVNYISATIPDAAAITIDRNGANPETVYAYGTQSAATGVTQIQITTNSAGGGATQATFTPAFSHSTGAMCTFAVNQSATFDNFGVAAVLSGTRVSPSTDLSSANVLQDSLISWTATTPGSSTVLVEASADGGTTWQACTNGAALPVLTPGMSLAGVGLQTRTTLTTTTATTLPTISGLSLWVIGQLQASGYRISPPLNLAPVGRIGSSLLSWNATLPNDNTTLGIDVSPDGLTWVDVSANNGQPIPFLTGQQDPAYSDDFSTDNSPLYASGSLAAANTMLLQAVPRIFGGTLRVPLPVSNTATWQVDTNNSRLIGTGGIEAYFVYTQQTMGDGEIIVDTDMCERGGVLWAIDTGSFATCYELTLQDSASSRLPANRMRLFKVVNGVKGQLGQGADLNFTRGVPTRFKIVQNAGTITVTVDTPVFTPDGALLSSVQQSLTYTDPSPLPAGYVGLRSSGGTNRYTQLRIQAYGQDVSSGGVVYTRERLATTDPLYSPQVQDVTVAVHSPTISDGARIPATTYSVLSGAQTTMAQNIDDLARQCGNYWWDVLNNTFYFQPQTGLPAPFVLTANDILEGKPRIVTRASDLYRNEQIIIGGTDTEARSETQIANGFKQGFETADAIDSIDSILLNGQAVSFGIQGVDSGKGWYYQQGQKGIKQDTSENPLANGQQVTINYQGLVNVIAKARHEGQIALLASIDGTSGVVTVVEKVDGLNQAAAQALAEARLIQNAILSIDLQFSTLRPGLTSGHLLPLFFTQHGLVNLAFLVTQVDYNPVMFTNNGQADLLEYFTVSCTSGPIVGGYEHLFG